MPVTPNMLPLMVSHYSSNAPAKAEKKKPLMRKEIHCTHLLDFKESKTECKHNFTFICLQENSTGRLQMNGNAFK